MRFSNWLSPPASDPVADVSHNNELTLRVLENDICKSTGIGGLTALKGNRELAVMLAASGSAPPALVGLYTPLILFGVVMKKSRSG